MSNRFSKAALLTGTIMAGAVFATPAFAQDDNVDEPGVTATQSAAESDDGFITVTGSRIVRRDLTSTSPVAVVQDEEFKLSGTVNVEQVINTLPQVIPGVTAFSNNPGNGAATLNLRGLGATRTLVLVNGRRWMFFDTAQVVDLNTIPSFLVDSVDVVTGGASAVYGSDALGGVVNFRLRQDLNGITAGGQVSITEEGDGLRRNAFVAIGSDIADNRGHVTVFGEYFKRDSVFQGQRDFSFFALGDGATELIPSGSSTPPQGRINGNQNSGNGGYAASFGDRFYETPGTSRARVSTDLYNYAPANYLQIPQERFLMGGYASYEITPSFVPYLEATFVNNRVQQELAATPVTGFFDINVTGACAVVSATECTRFQTAGAVRGDPNIIESIFIQRRTTETGSRNSFDERNAFRLLMGVGGEITPRFSYDASYFYARTRNANIQQGNISRSAFQAGLLDATNPLNIYGPNTLTPAMVDRISITAQNNDISQLHVATGAITGQLFETPWAADSVGFALGVEYRKVSAEFVPDTALSSGDVIGFNAGNPTQGSYDVKEAFAELRIPIIQDGFLHRLELNGAARYSDYSLDSVGGVWAYAAGIEFAPIRDITFRGQYQRAVRAPNVGELFGGQSIGFPPATDPCASPAGLTEPVRSICLAQGVPAAALGIPFNQPGSIQLNAQIPSTFGGNPNLSEETSDTFTVGAVIRPSFIPRLNVTVDYYNIEVKDTIFTVGTALIFDLCYFVTADVNSSFCRSINRNPGGIISGEQFSVNAGLANIANLKVSGVDLQVDYSVPLGLSMFGSGESNLNFFFLGTWTDESNFTPLSTDPTSETFCAGTFGLVCGEPTPEFKWTSRLSWIDGPMTTSLRWRHISGVDDDDPSTDYIVESLDAYDLFDLTLGFDVNENLNFTAGVRNLFDKKPQLIGSNQEQANTYPSTYDVLGRDYFVSATLRF